VVVIKELKLIYFIPLFFIGLEKAVIQMKTL